MTADRSSDTESGLRDRSAPAAGASDGRDRSTPVAGDGSRTDGEDPPVDVDHDTAVDLDRDRPVDVDHAPPRTAQVMTVVAILLGALSTAPYATLAIPFGLAGVAIVAAAIFWRYSRSWLTAGTALVLVGALVTGAYGAVPSELMVVGVGATLLAWDVGQHGIVIGEQLGRDARTDRNLQVHAATGVVTIGIVSAIAYVSFRLAGSGRPAPAVTVVVIGLVIAAWVFRS